MARPKFFRDPVHGQIAFDAVDLAAAPPSGEERPDASLSWLIRNLIECPEFQRLRHIRQNGLVNLVYHGAENSRFGHSMGVCHLAREMYQRIVRNMGEPIDPRRRLATCAAALLHDIGHGPFSHVLEEILTSCGIPWSHEWMTRRLILESPEDAAAENGRGGAANKRNCVHAILRQIDSAFPAEVALYINKKWRDAYDDQNELVDHWSYKIVSSQLDADRLDYLLRDAYFAGLKGRGFDLQRLLDMLLHLDSTRIAVHRRAIEPVEGYMLSLDQMYRTVYYHHTARAASVLLGCVLRRAFDLYKDGASDLFPTWSSRDVGTARARHPIATLFDTGQDIPLSEYLRLTEFHVYALIEEWQHHRDLVLADLSRRLLRRSLFKAIDVDPRKYNSLQRLQKYAQDLVRSRLSHVDPSTVQYYVCVDEPERLSYKRYDWRNANPDESIWVVDGSTGNENAVPIEKEPSSIIAALQTVKYFHRLMVPSEIRAALLKEMSNLSSG
jgi:HD superfamily phosphohydrolase